jgi:hypothetical protein
VNSISERGEPVESVLNGQSPRLIFRNEDRSNNRNLSSLIEELSSLGLMIAHNENALTISKEYGTYQINLQNGSVEFTPTTCERCCPHATCRYATKRLCIIEVSQGWVNFPLLEVDLFILSIVFAILYDLLPENLLEQIRKLSRCLLVERDVIIEDYSVKEFKESLGSIKIQITSFPKAPPIQGPVPPPK